MGGVSWCGFVAFFLSSLSTVSLEKMSLSHFPIIASQNVALYSQCQFLSTVGVLRKDCRFILR